MYTQEWDVEIKKPIFVNVYIHSEQKQKELDFQVVVFRGWDPDLNPLSAPVRSIVEQDVAATYSWTSDVWVAKTKIF